MRKETIIKEKIFKEAPSFNQTEPANLENLSWEERKNRILKKAQETLICRKCEAVFSQLDKADSTVEDAEKILAEHKCSEKENFSEKQILADKKKQDQIIANLQEDKANLLKRLIDLNKPLTNQELLVKLIKKLESYQLQFAFEDEDNKLYLATKDNSTRIYLFSLKIENDANISAFSEDSKVWQEVNKKFSEQYLAERKETQELAPSNETFKEDNSKLVQLQGILTSAIRPKPSANIDFYGYLRTKESKHSLAECEKQKCQECEIPIVFRWISKNHRMHDMEPKEPCFNEQEHWQKPELKKGQSVLLTGSWAKSEHSSRDSFTCSAYQILDK